MDNDLVMGSASVVHLRKKTGMYLVLTPYMSKPGSDVTHHLRESYTRDINAATVGGLPYRYCQENPNYDTDLIQLRVRQVTTTEIV